MKRFYPIRIVAISLLTFSALGSAQDPANPPQDQQPAPQSSPAPTTDNGGWKRIGDSNAAPQSVPAAVPQQPATLPPQLTLKPGTYVTVQINQPLSSDRNQVGDGFSATLVRPIIVDGWVIAERGQTLGGRVSEVKKAHGGGGTSRLGVQLTDIPLANGDQIPVQTQLISRQGPSSAGRDASAIAGTTAFGAAVGAAAAWGTGAAIGAGAGFAAATIGVLLSHGYPSVIPPESILTFRIEQPVTISTTKASQTFRPVEPGDYDNPAPRMQTRGPAYSPPPRPAYYYGAYPGPAYYPYYPYYWGPAFYGGAYFGPRFYYGRRW